jgi:hypothetical protein
MFDAIRLWWKSPSVFEVNQLFSDTLAKCIAAREAIEAEELAEERAAQGDSLPPPARDSGPDVFDGLTTSAHP